MGRLATNYGSSAQISTNHKWVFGGLNGNARNIRIRKVWRTNSVRVSHKPDRNRTPKAYKEREIPIPTKPVKELNWRKAKLTRHAVLCFPTSGCNPKLDFLDCVKACAERAKLDKDNFWLHKFRLTFATRCL